MLSGTGSRNYERFLSGIVAIVAVLVYVNSLGNGFVWDDANVIVNNPAVQGTPSALFRGIDRTRDYELLPYYRPLTLLTFLVEERLHGLTAWAMHLVNILLHAANAVLVYFLARSLLIGSNAALLAGLLFAIHPVHTEAVDFLSTRNTLLSGFFVLSAYLLHRKSVSRETTAEGTLGSLLFLAGLLAKESAMAVIPFIAALEIAPLRGISPGSRIKAARRLLPYGVVIACYIVMRSMTLADLGIQTGIIPGIGAQTIAGLYKIPAIGERLLNNLYTIPRYLWTILCPSSLNPMYEIPDDFNGMIVQLAASWLCICGVLVWLLTRGRSRGTLFGLAWLIGFWLPVSGIIWFPSAPLAERYLYVPLAGLWIIVADQMVRLAPSGSSARRSAASLVLLLLVVLAGFTVKRNLDWKNDITLFSRMAAQHPDNPFGYAGLGEAYLKVNGRDERHLAAAEEAFQKALALRSILPGVHTQLGYIRLARGDSAGAVDFYTTALKIFPSDKDARLNRGIALENLGRTDEALLDFNLFLATPGHELADARPYAEARVRALTR